MLEDEFIGAKLVFHVWDKEIFSDILIDSSLNLFFQENMRL